MKFKNDLIKQDWSKIDERLRTLICFGDLYSMTNWSKELIVTDLIRPRVRQIALYKKLPEYKNLPVEKIPHSVHEYGRGADLRTKHLEYWQKFKLVEIFNLIPYGKGHYQTAIFHDIGSGEHIHLQVKYK